MVLKGTSDTYPMPHFARQSGTQPAFLYLHCKPGSKPVCAFVNLNLHQVEPTQSVGKYKCPLHFYSADQRLAVQNFLAQHAREAPGSRASLRKALSAISHVAFQRAREDPSKKNKELQLGQGCYHLMPKHKSTAIYKQLGEHFTEDYE